ncbi:Z1 domain-containing protein [Amycolatopsis silviterrae]|uniref:Z1 domain-containing protein n=1 Tax=Amycolatopsis silviterrae TaxID=1656914 RepID=A0ABW5HN78_9PSEU
MTDSPYVDAYLGALAAMTRLGKPRDLNALAAAQAELLDADIAIEDELLRRHLETAGLNDSLRSELLTTTAKWDNAPEPDWAEGTTPNTPARREVITRLLKFGDETAALFNEKCSIAGVPKPTVIAQEWAPWYTDDIRKRRTYYWRNYEEYLATRKGWSPEARASLDIATDRVVERLADPTQPESYKAKGLVAGYVQSGKTANFTGVVAKAIDVGYRLVIVLTGTTDILRAQTQRRLDMELVGRENILGGADEDDPVATHGLDYQDDRDWIERRFLEHGISPRLAGRPNIHRLTTQRGDYKSLSQGIIALDFPRRDEGKPIYDPDNLFTTDARLAVVKKNSRVLDKLVVDLKRSAARMEDLPVLLVDDESDQASVNTSNPKKWKEDRKERTAINRLIAQLLSMLPRAQYVGYTATPFANVFVDPSDAEDIFPNDFLISLPRTPGYMGPEDFHDLDSTIPDDALDYANSNRKAHVRFLPDEMPADHSDLRAAMDTFVLAGAIKLYREATGDETFRHHTMLVHEHAHTIVHREQADRIRKVWEESGYYTSTAHERLRTLFEDDVLPVMHARSDGRPVPSDYARLAPHIGEVLARVGSSGNPVLVVNSDKIEGENLDFDRQAVWRILVGGNKLARGFTVEGLTVSYYRRQTKQGATLMQMGRWFGYRKGYRDLVRLYITDDMYEAFEAVCLDEKYFRDQLDRYAELVDGKPQITPAQVPPLVAQHLPGLRPDAPNKMYNAKLTERRSPGFGVEPTAYPVKGELLAANVETFAPLFAAANGDIHTFKTPANRDFQARVGIVSHGVMLRTLEDLIWGDGDNFAPDLAWLRRLNSGDIHDWAVIFPQLGIRNPSRLLIGSGPFSLHHRDRRRPPYFGALSDPKHRAAADCIAGVPQVVDDEQARTLLRPRRGALLVYPVIERDPSGHQDGEADIRQVVMTFRVTAPTTADRLNRPFVTFVTKNSLRATDAIVDK